MKNIKATTIVQLIAIAILFNSCGNLKQSNFNRQKYLHLKQQETNVADNTVEINSTNAEKLFSESLPVFDSSMEIPSLQSEITGEPLNKFGDVVSKEEETTSTSIYTESEQINNPEEEVENETTQMNDTLFYKSGLNKPCIIVRWDESFVYCSYLVRGVMTEDRIPINALDCFVVYDSHEQLQYRSENCTSEQSRQNEIDEHKLTTEDKISRAANLMAIFIVLAALVLVVSLLIVLSNIFSW